MNNPKLEVAIRKARELREMSDALIVVAIMPGGDIIQSTDARITIPDLHGTLQDSVDFICSCVARHRKLDGGRS